MNKVLSAAVCISICGMTAGSVLQNCPDGELQVKAQALADLAVKEGLQGALQFCAFKDGKCIVDVWAGAMTTNAGAAKIDGDTLFPIFSTEKPLLATAVHRSVERGKLEYDKPVSIWWTEFRGGGKERLTVRELMAYRSGLPDAKPGTGWDDFTTVADWNGMLEWYASCEPQIEPGTKQRYMPKSYGWALGGLLEKAWGRPANDILREQVLIPAGIEKDFYFVCGDDEIPRIATVYKGKTFESMNNDIPRRSLLPSAWAVSSARGIAKFYNRLCGFDGQPPLVSKETLDAALEPCRHESDPLPDAEGMKKWHMIFGMGYGLWGEADNISRVFGHGGIGGSEGLCDRSQRLVIGYTCNFDNAPPKLREAFYSLVGMRWRYWKDDVNIQDLQMATAEKGNVASGGSGKSPRGTDLALADAETVEVADAVQDVRAVSRQGAATLFVNGVRFATAEPDADGNITFRSVPFVRGVTQLQLEAGGRAVKVSKRRGRPEGAPKGVEVKKREDPRTAWFEDARFGLFIHWGIYSIPGRGEWTYATDDWKPGEYESLAGQFNPTNYNPRKWARLAKAAGMKYVVFTTRHHDGFCMFDSHFSDYKITKTPYGKDTLRMLVDAFRAEGLRIGFYHSLPDWTHPGYADLETPIGIKTGKVAPYDAAKHEKFKRLVYNHVNQLTTEYGKIDLMFFDFTSKFKDGVDYFDRDALIALCRRNQPDMLINDRLAYFKDRAPDFDYYTPEVAVPSAAPIVRGTERPWETCATMNDHWGYARDDHNFKSVEILVAGLVGCVSRNGNLLLNVGPTELGEFPPESVACLEGLADWYASNGESITGCGKSDLTPPFGCAYTQKGSSLYCHVLVPPMGDLILPGLDGRTARLTMLRTGEPVETIDFWGFETLRLGDLRIRAKGLRVGDVVKIELNQ